MRVILQRVSAASVSVDGSVIASIKQGLLILLGIGPQDTTDQVQVMAEKTATLRIFEDDDGKMNLSLADIQGEALVVSQFTLYADTRKGRRPSFTDAAPPAIARPLVEYFAQQLRQCGIPTQTGQFGAHMLVEIHNDGPVTIELHTD